MTDEIRAQGGGVAVGGNVVNSTIHTNVHYHYESDGQKPDIPSPPKSDLPPDDPNFIGRVSELAYFQTKLEQTNCVLITGMAGVGKTALAVALARRAYPLEKIFWHSFHNGEGLDTLAWKLAGFLAGRGQDQLWRYIHLSRSAGASIPLEVLLDYLRHQLHGQKCLLCLDELHEVDEEPLLVNLVEQLTQAAQRGELALLITSRRAPVMVELPDEPPLEGLSLADALQFLVARNLNLPESRAAEIHKITQGNAVFLTLAANALRRERSPEKIIANLSQVESIERYLISKVDNALSESERGVMQAAALLVHPASRDALEAVLEGENIRRTLSKLTQRNLLVTREGGTGREYTQNAILQSFYYDLLDRRQRLEMHRRAGEYYRSVEPDVSKAVLHFLRASQYHDAAALASEEVWTAIRRGQGRALLNLIMELQASQLEAELWAKVNIARGELCGVLGEYDLAHQYYREAHELLTSLPVNTKTQQLIARLCRGLGELLQYEDPVEALEWLLRGQEALAGIGDVEQNAALSLLVGNVHILAGNYEAALQAVEKGLAQLPERPSDLHIDAYINLGTIYAYQGDVHRSNAYTRQALALSQALGDDFRRVTILGNLGLDEFMSGDWPAGVRETSQALELAEQLGSKAQQARLALSLGWMCMNQGDDHAARAHLSRCLEIAQMGKLNEFLISGNATLADLCLRQGELTLAAEAVQRSLGYASQAEMKDQLPEIYRHWAVLSLAQGNLPAAQEALERSLQMAQEIGMPGEEGMSLRIVAQTQNAAGQPELAWASFARSLDLLADNPYEAARTQAAWGQALLAQGQRDGGQARLDLARATFEQLGARRDLEHL